MHRRLALALAALVGCAHPPPSNKPLGGTASVEQTEPHRDRRAAAEVSIEDGDESDPEPIAPAPAPPPPPLASVAPPAPAASTAFEFSYTPLKPGDVVRAGSTMSVRVNVRGSDLPGMDSMEIESSSKSKLRISKASPAKIDEIEIEFLDGRMRSKFGGVDSDEPLRGEKYVLDLSGSTASAKDGKGQNADDSRLGMLVFLVEPLAELQARMAGKSPARLSVGWSDSVTPPHFSHLLTPPPDVRIGPLELKLKAIVGAAPNESASFDLKLPVVLSSPTASARIDLAGTGTLPRHMRPIEIVLSGPVSGLVPMMDAEIRMSGSMRYDVRYDFGP